MKGKTRKVRDKRTPKREESDIGEMSERERERERERESYKSLKDKVVRVEKAVKTRHYWPLYRAQTTKVSSSRS